MSKHYFKKELVSNHLYDNKGSAIPFEICAGNCGVIVLDDENATQAVLADILGKTVGRHGVVRIDEAKYDELKKKPLLNKPNSRLKEPRLFDQKQDPWRKTAQEQIIPPKSVTDATAPADVVPAAEKFPAENAEAQAGSPSAPARKPRTGRAKPVVKESQLP
jgi:hypothetical protein